MWLSFQLSLAAIPLLPAGRGEGPADGMGAMIGAWWCGAEAARRRCRLIDVELMQDIRAYNEVDCKAMMEIVRYLREEH